MYDLPKRNRGAYNGPAGLVRVSGDALGAWLIADGVETLNKHFRNKKLKKIRNDKIKRSAKNLGVTSGLVGGGVLVKNKFNHEKTKK